MPSVVTTLDGPVFVDLFKFRDTYGIPLSTCISWCLTKPILFSVPHFIIDARRARWAPEKIRSELREAYFAFLPKQLVDEFMKDVETFIC